MKNELSKKLVISIVVFCIALSYLTYSIGHNLGQRKGISIALDTVSRIIEKHIKLDTIKGNTAKFIIINPDTTVYILNSKKLYK
jgi:hypothetical protein